ncbi:four-carbon acid sugar kinase family protein [Candidatus Sumerlaeota bacterium]|nr:four-carbon acid sugar kinase family protein [Candidatus Sumerlaeota bacterium]
MSKKNDILFAFYGDDFTGTTATAEALAESGVPTVVFSEPPSPALLAERFPRVRAVGVAGTSRTLPTIEMESVLRPVFEAMREYGAPVFLYKVCSTFDSSPQIGSIGRAIEIGRDVFSSDWIPVLPAAPRFRRFTVFGHHFAGLGEGAVYRLDRHPSMSRHPVTPMTESDLRLHLSSQTSLASGLVDLLALEQGADRVEEAIERLRSDSIPIALFDCLFERHMTLACRAIWRRADRARPIFCVGSQELGCGFGSVWRESGLLSESDAAPDPENGAERGPILVLSGSCATVTAEQIRRAIEQGFIDVPVEPDRLLAPSDNASERRNAVSAALEALSSGNSVVVHTAMGTNDPRVARAKQTAQALSLPATALDEAIGDALGQVALDVLEQSNVKRLAIAGGDSSGRIQKRLGIRALQVARPVGVAAPLCYAYSSLPRANGLEIAFKGGQAGAVDCFDRARRARTLDFADAALGTMSD